MRKKSKKKIKKKTLKKKRRIKANSRKASRNESVDLQKIVGFKFQALNKAYENFKIKRRKEREKQEKSKLTVKKTVTAKLEQWTYKKL